MKQLNKISFILLVVLLAAGCASKKKKNAKPSFLGRVYHNTTAKYNGYFNANVLLTESIDKLNQQHQDNYNKVLDLYKYVAAPNPQAVAGDLDNAIKKVSIVVSLHRASHWTDDCYLLIAQAQHLKKDFESAEETLLYLTEEYSPEAMEKRASKSEKKKNKKKALKEKRKKKELAKKKRKKKLKKKRRKKKKRKKKKKKTAAEKKAEAKIVEETKRKEKEAEAAADAKKDENGEKPDKYFLKHRPAYQEAMLWLARNHIERQAYEQAQNILTAMDQDPKTFKYIRREMAAVQAHFYLKQKNYTEALEPLKQALELAKEKTNKARYAYIIAQINQNEGRGDVALEYFDLALKYSTDYEMEFSSKLNLAQNAYVNGQATAEEAKSSLKKMLKDIKNEDYKDQIYYALAEISLKGKDKQEAIDNLKLSLTYSKKNSAQKTESYLQLAELYFDTEQYVEAKNYYDSTLLVMDKTDERYDQISIYGNNLSDIARNLSIIKLQDSLLRISAMTDDEKRLLALNLKQQQEKDKLASTKGPGKYDKYKKSGGRNRASSTSPLRGRTSPSTFFAYNERALRKGGKDFERLWGKRNLEDNWRRSNRSGLANFGVEEEDPEKVALQELSDKEVADLLKDVPNTPADKEVANQKIEAALFALGRLYREKLSKNEKAVETLERLLKKYPNTKNELDAWYYLYLAHTDLNQTSAAKAYYAKIIKKYPNTTYARVLQDPNFLAASKEEERKLILYYNETFYNFQEGKFKTAYEKVTQADQLFGPNNVFNAKFALLNAMCLGNIKGKEDYIKSLKEVVAKYPETAEQKRANEILRLLGERPNVRAGKNKKDKKNGGKYKVQDNKVHYALVLLKDDKKLSPAKISVSDYNRKYNKLAKLRISNIYLDREAKTPVLVIRRFKNKEAAMNYFQGIKGNSKDFMASRTEYELFVITQFNYREVLKAKDITEYRAFFEENYLN
ncbi:MAG: tetratricopeptide repeat protein [Saprospiraceae bacterium]